jgi:DNA-binding NtrC family response regulator
MAHVSDLPVLLVDDEPQLLRSASIVLRAAGISHVETLDDSRAVLPLLASRDVGVLVLDLTMPHISGHTLLGQLAADYPDVPVILLTATNDLETAVQSMQAGATDYLVKPVDGGRLVSSVKRAIELRSLRAEVLSLKERFLTDTPHQREAFADIVTQSPAMFAIFRYVEAIAPSPQPVLITGETGTGKELIAGALHRLSGRTGELVAVNVAGLDDTMFTDTLFGHTRGAFTGADRPREGLLASAGHGTVFLDEIGDLSIASQVKLLRVLQTGSFYPLGADHPRQAAARVVVATNCDVAQAVAAGTFRRDLLRVDLGPKRLLGDAAEDPLVDQRDLLQPLPPADLGEGERLQGRDQPPVVRAGHGQLVERLVECARSGTAPGRSPDPDESESPARP